MVAPYSWNTLEGARRNRRSRRNRAVAAMAEAAREEEARERREERGHYTGETRGNEMHGDIYRGYEGH